MRFEHPDLPGRGVRLAYCLNLHPAEDLEGVLGGVDQYTLPLAARMGVEDGFGLGSWLAASVAMTLGVGEGIDEYLSFLADARLDPFTYNAFPYGGFHRDGLKAGVFRPTWQETLRVAFTASVAGVAARAWEHCGRRSSHVSISTHPGKYGAEVKGRRDLEICADNFARTAGLFARIERETGCRIILSIEAEPRASAGTTQEVAELIALVGERAGAVLSEEQSVDPNQVAEIIRRHLGTCLDACHAAVEFEHPQDAFLAATREGSPLGKLQFSSALEVGDPQGNAVARERLLALDEPVYLHQVTARTPEGLLRASDLPEVRDAWAAEDPGWRSAAPWRCHFHVPVDLDAVGAESGGLGTTRDYADELLAIALGDPDRWGTEELHLEIETYTWDVMPGEARGEGSLVDALEREYGHVEGVLARSGWRRCPQASPSARG